MNIQQPSYDYLISQQDHISYSSIKPITSIRNFLLDINSQIDFYQQKALIAFDIDDTILFKAIQNTNLANNSTKVEVKLEANLASNINNISKYADVICITARTKNDLVNLQQYGVNLITEYNEIILTNQNQQIIQDQGYFYSENIFYTGLAEKGMPLKLLYDFSNSGYDKVFFIDDIEINCMFVNNVLTNSNIQVQTYNITTTIDNLLINNKENKLPIHLENKPIKKQAYFYTN
jgi:hypothetical protein